MVPQNGLRSDNILTRGPCEIRRVYGVFFDTTLQYLNHLES
jgi:hypothetical protein